MNGFLIVDSSVIVKWLNQTNEQNIDQADKIMEDTLSGKVELIAPELAKYEVGNVLLLGKRLTINEAVISLGTLHSLPITFVTESEDLAKQTFNIAGSISCTYYDATFLSLAKQYNGTLVTDNIKHQGKAPEIKVINLADYPLD